MKVACVSVSRADWNALGMVAMALREQGADVQTWTDDHHDAPEMIAADGFTPRNVGWMDVELVVLLGDRFATLQLAAGYARQGMPIAHLAGGDITEGSQDDGYRHAITKLAHLHFPTHATAAARILQMGEEGWRVMAFGSASIDRLRVTATIETKQATLDAVSGGYLSADRSLVVVNCQPDTLDTAPARAFFAIKDALSELLGANIVIVGANDDAGGAAINSAARELADLEPRVRFAHNLPSQVYLSLLRHADLLIGNSSSAYYEAPVLGCRAIDVGNRQAGRAGAANVLRCRANAYQLEDCIRGALMLPRQGSYPTPFGNGSAAPAIAKAILIHGADRQRLLRKKFIDNRHWTNPVEAIDV